jgi:peptidoglycan hydrolase CwlO-like protein
VSNETGNQEERGGKDAERRGSKGPPRLEELGEQVTRATKVIAELRESNYELSGEVASLKRQLEEAEASLSEAQLESEPKSKSESDVALDTDPDPESGANLESESESDADSDSDSGDGDGIPDEALTAKLDMLSEERQEIRSKVEALLERIEELESRL